MIIWNTYYDDLGKMLQNRNKSFCAINRVTNVLFCFSTFAKVDIKEIIRDDISGRLGHNLARTIKEILNCIAGYHEVGTLKNIT